MAHGLNGLIGQSVQLLAVEESKIDLEPAVVILVVVLVRVQTLKLSRVMKTVVQ